MYAHCCTALKSLYKVYLNDDMAGGETSFPRWVNGQTFRELKVKPEAGKAILFYDQLPDGNMDDFSQHSAKPVIRGEKWLINLWVRNIMVAGAGTRNTHARSHKLFNRLVSVLYIYIYIYIY